MRISGAILRVLLWSSLLAVPALGLAPRQAPPAAASLPLAYLTVTLDKPGRPIPSDFTGLSMEYPAVGAYLGVTPKFPNMVFQRLLTNLGPGSLRIGGDSQDTACWRPSGRSSRSGCAFTISPALPRVVFATMAAAGWRALLGLNLALNDPVAARTYVLEGLLAAARPYPHTLLGLEIGNEPDVYSQHGLRPPSYSLARYLFEATHYVNVLKGDPRTATLPLAGPSFVRQDWDRNLHPFIARVGARTLAFLTLHYYPLSACSIPSRARATAAALLSAAGRAALASRIAGDMAVARAAGLPLRLDETNSVSCHGKVGLSDSFAAALWGLDLLFTLAQAGVRGVNMHIYDLDRSPGRYNPIVSTATRTAKGTWVYATTVRPLYYALALFRQAEGGRILPVTLRHARAAITAYAVGTGRMVKVFVLNKDPHAGGAVTIAPLRGAGTATVTYLRAPTLASTRGTTLGGQVVERGTGTLLPPRSLTLRPDSVSGAYRVPLPVASVATVTLNLHPVR